MKLNKHACLTASVVLIVIGSLNVTPFPNARLVTDSTLLFSAKKLSCGDVKCNPPISTFPRVAAALNVEQDAHSHSIIQACRHTA